MTALIHTKISEDGLRTDCMGKLFTGQTTDTKKIMTVIQPEMDFTKGPDLNKEEGMRLRDEGIKRAEDHANKVDPDWSKKAYEFFINRFLLYKNGPFMAEEVRSYAAEVDFPLPPSARAWGGVFQKARHEGIIKSMGTKPVRNKKAHRANAALWIQVKPSERK